MNANQQIDASYKLANNFSRLLAQLAKDFENRTLQKCHQRGHTNIRQSHSSLLSSLGASAIRLTELAERAGISQQAMGKLVQEMERAGYVKRHVDESDKRAKIIELTKQGMNLVNDSVAIVDEVIAEYRESIGSEGINELERVLHNSANALNLGFAKTPTANQPAAAN